MEKPVLALAEPAKAEIEAFERLIGETSHMRSLKAYLIKVAATDCTVLITGETGTGKELVVDIIHRQSMRKQQPLVCVNCAALPESLLESELFGYERGAFTGAFAARPGKFELADHGILFLDEIGEMPVYGQAKLLRAVESKEIFRVGGKKSIPLDMRLIAATNQEPERLVAEGKFRKDLFFRLNVARIHLPPLRERNEDLPLLLAYYVGEMNRRFGRSVEGFSEEALEYLLRYEWPGNVRELKNLCEAIFINLPSRQIAFVDLPELYQKKLKESEALPPNERERLLAALFATNWNVSKTARQLHWSRMTVYRKLTKYHLQKADSAIECPPQALSQCAVPCDNGLHRQ